MDSDQRLQRMAGSLRAVLKPRDLIDELLARRVLTKGEYEEINAVTLNRGNMEGNRCLIRHMLIGKSTRQVDDFLKVILEIQREEVLGIIREKIRPVSSDLHGGDERSPLAIETFPIEISEPLAALAASGNDVGPSLGGSGPRRITQGARVGGSVQETGSANGVLDTHRPHERFPQASSNPPGINIEHMHLCTLAEKTEKNRENRENREEQKVVQTSLRSSTLSAQCMLIYLITPLLPSLHTLHKGRLAVLCKFSVLVHACMLLLSKCRVC